MSRHQGKQKEREFEADELPAEQPHYLVRGAMKDKERYEKAKRKAEERAKELFQPVPDDIKEELEKESTLGTPDNLVDRSDDEEE